MMYYWIPMDDSDDTDSLFSYDGKTSYKIYGDSKFVREFDITPNELEELIEKNKYMIVSLQDAKELVEDARQDGYRIFKELIAPYDVIESIVFLNKDESDGLKSFLENFCFCC